MMGLMAWMNYGSNQPQTLGPPHRHVTPNEHAPMGVYWNLPRKGVSAMTSTVYLVTGMTCGHCSSVREECPR